MNAGTIGDRTAGKVGTTGPQRSSTHFPRELARAELQKRAAGTRAEAGSTRSRAGTNPVLRSPIGLGERSIPCGNLLRRRGEADQKDERLVERRDIDRFAQLTSEWSTTPLPVATGTQPSAAATLAAAIEQLEATLERQKYAQDPTLEMQFGRRLHIRITRGRSGLELAISGDPAMARLARSELPALVARLRKRGLVVSQAQVRTAPMATNTRKASSSAGRR